MLKTQSRPCRPLLPPRSNVANTSITSAAPFKTQEQLKKEQLAAEAKKLKSQILARSSSTGSAASLATGGQHGPGVASPVCRLAVQAAVAMHGTRLRRLRWAPGGGQHAP